MLIISKSDQALQRLEGRTLQWLANFAAGATTTALLENVIAPGGAVPPHRHPVEELLVCLEGDGEVVADEARYPFKAGDTAVVPAQTLHAVRNLGQSPLRILGFFPTAQPVATALDGQPLLQSET
jgi:quercetin dioxygenase-like cupin family protein